MAFILNTLSNTAFSQPATNFSGLIFDDSTYEKMDRLPAYTGSKYDELDSLKMSLRWYAPPPGDQGQIPSCVGWAVGYCALTISRASQNKITEQSELKNMANSALYIYNQIKADGDDCKIGSTITDALLLLREKGDCLASEFDPGANCLKMPNALHHESAARFKIKEALSLFGVDEKPEIKVDRTRKSIADGKPVVIGLELVPSFFMISPGTKTWSPSSSEVPTTGHALCITGYNEFTKTFEAMNSWGEDWGDNGYIRIKYDDFGKYCKYGFQITLSERKQGESVELQGNFIFRYPVTGEGDNPAFEHANPFFNGNYFELEKKDWKVGDLFQLVSKEMQKNTYSYVFSIDAENKAEVHWPRERVFKNEDLLGLDEVPLVPNKNAEIIVPGKYSALRLAHPGTDYLIVIYSDERIDDIRKRVLKVQQAKGDILSRLDYGFSDRIIPLEEINYSIGYGSNEKPTMSFHVQSRGGTAVPIILAVEAK